MLDVLQRAADSLTLAADKLDALVVCMSPNPVTSGWNESREMWNCPVTESGGQADQMERPVGTRSAGLSC